MIIAGIGFRASVTLPSLQALLGQTPIDALAVAADKADHPVVAALVQDLAKPLFIIALRELATDRATTPAPQQPDRYGHMSLAEATALAAAGPEARLIQSRLVSPDGTATLAIAEGPDI
jgi:cobalt-precorrin 5A hydrolase